MTIYMIACSKRAYERMQELKEKWLNVHKKETVQCFLKCSLLAGLSDERSVREIAEEGFRKADVLVFFCALGIAVRSIAPFIEHKSKDPAVVVVDETGKFCIPVLSGHAGGANAFAKEAAALLDAVLVVTTATDLEGKFAVDEFARKNRLTVTDWKMAKEIAVRLLAEESIDVYTQLPIEGDVPGQLHIIQGELPEEVYREEEMRQGNVLQQGKVPQMEKQGKRLCVWISEKTAAIRKDSACLQLVPRRIAVGIGCKKGTSKEKIKAAAEQCLREHHIRKEAVMGVASISLKAKEQGLLEYCRENEFPYVFFEAEQLQKAEGEFSESAFVKETTGVSNVCERSAVLLAAEEGEPCLICKKTVYDGVTVALARQERRLVF